MRIIHCIIEYVGIHGKVEDVVMALRVHEVDSVEAKRDVNDIP